MTIRGAVVLPTLVRVLGACRLAASCGLVAIGTTVVTLLPARANLIDAGALASAQSSYRDLNDPSKLTSKSVYRYYGQDAFLSPTKSYIATSLPMNLNSTVGSAGSGALVTGGNDPSVSTSASIVFNQYSEGAIADAQLGYYIEVTGPGSGQIPIDVTADYSGSCSYGFYGTQFGVCSAAAFSSPVGSFTINGPNGIPDNGIGNATISYPGSGTVQGTYTAEGNVTIGQSYSVFIETASDAICDGDSYICGGPLASISAASTAAMIDPLFTVDPNFPDASLYKIVQSSNLESSPNSVPEPSSQALLGSGVVFLLLLAPRRKRLVSC